MTEVVRLGSEQLGAGVREVACLAQGFQKRGVRVPEYRTLIRRENFAAWAAPRHDRPDE